MATGLIESRRTSGKPRYQCENPKRRKHGKRQIGRQLTPMTQTQIYPAQIAVGIGMHGWAIDNQIVCLRVQGISVLPTPLLFRLHPLQPELACLLNTYIYHWGIVG